MEFILFLFLDFLFLLVCRGFLFSFFGVSFSFSLLWHLNLLSFTKTTYKVKKERLSFASHL